MPRPPALLPIGLLAAPGAPWRGQTKGGETPQGTKRSAKAPCARSIASRQGIEGWAPAAVVASEPATTPTRAAASTSSPSARRAAMAPQAASPAPVVSTTLTEGAGTSVVSPSNATAAPAAPSVTTTAFGPSASRLPAAEAPSWLTGRSSSSAASVSLTTSRSTRESRPRPSRGSGVAFNTTTAPRARAALTRGSRVARGSSSVSSSTAGRTRSIDARAASGVTLRVAPGTYAIRFCPDASSTVISATPEGAAAISATSCVSISAARRSARRARPKSSRPTAPSTAVRAPERAAATAWFAPLPPPKTANDRPVTVSPASGARCTRATRSVLIAPATSTPPRAPPLTCRSRARRCLRRGRAPRPRRCRTRRARRRVPTSRGRRPR